MSQCTVGTRAGATVGREGGGGGAHPARLETALAMGVELQPYGLPAPKTLGHHNLCEEGITSRGVCARRESNP